MKKQIFTLTIQPSEQQQAELNYFIRFRSGILRLFIPLILAIFLPSSLLAYGFEVDGINYYQNSINSVTVTSFAKNRKYSGDVNIPNWVTYMGMLYKVTEIGGWAFSDCSGLTSVTIPNSVTSIGFGAFQNCSSLTSIEIPNSVTSIAPQAFFGCSSLTSIEIPNSVTEIGGVAFSECDALDSIIVSTGNTTYDSRNNCNAIIETATNTLIVGCKNTQIPNSATSIGEAAFRGCGGLTQIEIPNSVTSIGRQAFYCCSSLTSIEIPNSVTVIGAQSFVGCSLTSLTIPSSVTSIGDDNHSNVFTGLNSVAVSPDNTKYDSRNDCNAIIETSSNKIITGSNCTTIPSSVTSIGKAAFSGCDGLQEIYIPASVTEIGSVILAGCSSLYSVTVDSENHVYDSRNNCNAIIETATNTLMAGCKSTQIPNSATSIGDFAFYNHSELTSIIIPNSISSIGNSAFYGCSGLTEVNLPNSVTSIGEYAFWGCSGLTSVTIPNSVTSIGNYVFSACGGLTSIDIQSSETAINHNTFGGCTGLTSLRIGKSVTSIEQNTFNDCINLSSIEVDSGNTKYDSRNKCNAIIETATNTLITGCKNTKIPNSVSSIGEGAFYGRSGLTSIIIPNSISSIGNSAFYGCSGLTELDLPNSISTIGNGSFEGCDGLTSLTIPRSVTAIGFSAFNGCYGLKSIDWKAVNCVDSNSSPFCNLTGITSFNIGAEVEHIPAFLCDELPGIKALQIPNSVTSIGKYAFFGCTGLAELDISNSVTSIGSYAFYGCSGLTSVTIPNSVTSIGNYVFYGCSGLTKVEISDLAAWCKISYGGSYANPLYCAKHLYLNDNEIKDLVIPGTITTIKDYAFYGCSGLTSVTIPNSVTSIGIGAFSGCSGLTGALTIPNSVTSIGEDAFFYCSGLTSVTIPKSVTVIGTGAFGLCRGLTKVDISDLTAWCGISFGSNISNPLQYAHHLHLDGSEIKDLIIPNDVTSIGNYAFSYCSGLTSVTIPNSVSSIGVLAFYNCSGLTSVTNLAKTPQTITSSVFRGVEKANCKLYVWHESLDDYKAAEVWKEFDIQDLGGVEDIEADDVSKEVEGYYNLQGIRLEEPARGQVNIVRYKDGTAKKVKLF